MAFGETQPTPLAGVGPVSLAAAGNVTTGFVQVPVGTVKFRVIVNLGVVGATPTHSLSAQQATSGAGAGSKNVAGITGTATVAGQYPFDFDVVQVLDCNGSFNFVSFTLTNNSGGPSLVAMTVDWR